MSNWVDQILYVEAPDPDIQRRGRILIGIALGLSLLALSIVPVVLTTTGQIMVALAAAIIVIVFLGAAYLGRIGRVNLGGYMLIVITTLTIQSLIYLDHENPSVSTYLLLMIMLAGVLLPPIQIWSIFMLSVVGMALAFGLLPAEVRDNPMWAISLRVTPLLLLMASAIMFISSRSLSTALATIQAARSEAEHASHSLAESNASLESRVGERTAELSRVLEEQQRTTRQLEESLATQRDMNRVIAELSVPIIPVTRDSLVVPLVGALDSERASQLLSSLLNTIEATRSRTIILDVTGVAVIDTQVAASLLRVAAAAGLMGAQTVLVGIRPEVAQTLVGLGVDLDAIHTAASLQDGLALIKSR